MSRSHPIAKRLRALRGDRELRDREGVLVAEGRHLAEEALRSKASIELAVASPRLARDQAGAALARRLAEAGVPIHEASEATLDALGDARTPQPVLVVVKRRAVPLDMAVRGVGGPPLLVVACGVQDPGNLGALLRVAEAAGATGLVATRGSADLFHPRTVRASAGSIFRLPAVEASAEDLLSAIGAAALVTVGADARGGTPYDAFDWTRPLALLLGGEGAGLPAELLPHLAARVGVPMRPPVESLSVSLAAAVLLFEAARRRASRDG